MIGFHAWAVLAFSLFGLLACQQQPQESLTTVDWVTFPEGLIDGKLVIRDGGCTALLEGAGLTGLAWAEGFTLARRPDRVLDAEGDVVAHDGDHIKFSGGVGLNPSVMPNNPCGTETMGVVAEIVTPEP